MHTTRPHIVITGGDGTLATAIADEFRTAGWTVEAPGRDALDVCDADAVHGYFANREPHLMVCAAGITRDAPLARLTDDAWDETWSVNFHGACACAAAVIPRMISRGSGHVVFISSFSATSPPTGQAAYAAAKAALLGLTRDLSRTHGPANIRVNAILPGFLDSRMTARVTALRRKEVLADHSLGCLNTCDRVAAFIRFLHENLPHTSGQTFQLDSR